MKCNDNVKNRLKRASGQMNGVLKMIEDERSCSDVLTQLSAINSSIEKVMGLIATQNLIQNIEEEYDIELQNLDEEINLILRTK